MNDTRKAIGIDFGGTSIKLGVVGGDKIIEQAPPIATQEFEGPDEIIATMAKVIFQLRQIHPEIEAVGIGVPGFVNFEKGSVYQLTNVRGWSDYPLRDKLSEIVGLPVSADNDANCMAFAEWVQGAGKDFKHLVCVTMGTGVGGGIIANGEMIRGAQFGAGEIGQTSIDYQGRVGHYENCGALEDYIGNNEIARDAQLAYLAAGISKDIEDCSPYALAEAAKMGDGIALAQWDQIGRMLATAMMNVCWLLNPEAIVIGGGVARAGEVLFHPFRKYLHQQLSGPFRDSLQILPAAFGHESGLIGAASLALHYNKK